MANFNICFIPTSKDVAVAQLDKTLADGTNLATGKYVATLRGLYEREHGEQDWDHMLPEEICRMLADFRADLHAKQVTTIRSHIKNMGAAFSEVKAQFSAVERANRVNMIVCQFSTTINDLLDANPTLTRNGICNGISIDGVTHFGETYIFDELFKRYCLKMQDFSYKASTLPVGSSAQIKAQEKADKYIKVLNNWEALVTMARIKLKDTEGLILGGSTSYAAEATSENFEDFEIDFNVEEATKEGWQEIAESLKAYASIGKNVRRIISMIPETLVENGVPVYNKRGELKVATDDLNIVKYLDPVKIHQILLNVCRGCTSSSQMAIRLKSMERVYPWAAAIFQTLSPIAYREISEDVLVTETYSSFEEAMQQMRSYAALQKAKLDPNSETYAAEIARIDQEVEAIASKNKQALQNRTQFFCDLRMNFIQLSVFGMKEDENASTTQGLTVQKPVTQILNRVNSMDAENTAVTNISKGNVLQSIGSLYDKEGFIDWENQAILEQRIKDFVFNPEEIQHNGTIKESTFAGMDSAIEDIKRTDREETLTFIMRGLGINMDTETAKAILYDKKSRDKVRNALRQLYSHGFNEGSFKTEKEAKSKLLASTALTFKAESLKKADPKKADIGVIREDIAKLTNQMVTHNTALKVESRVPYVDRHGNPTTLSSDVNPSYLGDKLDAIKEFVEARDLQGLHDYIESNFFVCPYFAEYEYPETIAEKGGTVSVYTDKNGRVYSASNVVVARDGSYYVKSTTPNGKNIPVVPGGYVIHNQWLKDLWNSDLSDPKSFATTLDYKRVLGDPKGSSSKPQRFENWSKQQHALNMLMEFMSVRETESKDKKNFAYYPVFILGDSGVCKYIKAPIYRGDEILNGLYEIYKQEILRARLSIETSQALQEMGYGDIDNFSSKWNKFTALPFLNEKFTIIREGNQIYAVHKDTGIKATATDIKNAIRSNFDSEFKTYLQELSSMGILERATQKDNQEKEHIIYKYLQNYTNGKYLPNIEGNTEEDILYKNLLAGYYNTRFATIQQIQMMSVDPAFYKNVKDMQKRYKEIHAPGKVLDVDAYDVYNNRPYASIYNNLTREFEPMQNELTVYFEDIDIDAAEVNEEFMEAIESVFGKNSEVYAQYRANTLTDGQGYRSLESYRKVMGMAGKWDSKMQETYEAIRAIQKKVSLDKSDIAKLQELSLVFQPIKPYLYTMERVTANKNGEQLLVPVQHKYAEVILIPELLPANSKLRKLAEIMERGIPDPHGEPGRLYPIDMVGSTKVVKVGGFGATKIDYKTNEKGLYVDKDGNVIPSPKGTSKSQKGNVNGSAKEIAQYELFKSLAVPISNTDLETQLSMGYLHKLPYQDYRIQTNVPEHVNHAALFGTQVRKLIMTHLDMLSSAYEDYLDGLPVNLGPIFDITNPRDKKILAEYAASANSDKTLEDSEALSNIVSSTSSVSGTRKLNGRSLLNFYNQLITANILENYRNFEKALDNIDKVSRQLIQNVISNSRESQDNIIAYCLTADDKFLVPLFEGNLEHDTAAALLSIFKKAVNKQQIAGGAAVQASAWGIDSVVEDDTKPEFGGLQYHGEKDAEGNITNILYADCEIPFNLKYTDANGKEVQLDFNKYCNPDGTLILSGRKIDIKRMPTGDNRVVDDSTEVEGSIVLEAQIEKDFPGILDIIAYRIPTESAYSMLNLRVKRFSKPTEGGTIKVPPQGTTQAGFDFDIDKLYLMRKEFKMRRLSKADTKELWNEWYKAHPTEAKALLQKKKEYEAQQAAAKEANNIADWFLGFFKDSELAEELLENRPKEISRSKKSFWKEAGISGTAEQALREFIETKSTQYLEEYDLSKPVSTTKDSEGHISRGNSRVARNNMLIHLIRRRLMDPETMKQRYTPGGFRNASKSARLLRELVFSEDVQKLAINGTLTIDKLESLASDKNRKDPEPEYDYSDPRTILIYNEQNQIAGKLIGVFANQNVNHAFASLMEEYTLVNPISFGNHALDGGLSDLIHHPNASETTAEFLAASVDAVKDPVLNFLNLNETTANAGAVLARLGYTTTEIGLLFNQPVIKELCDYIKNTPGISVDEAIEMIVEKWKPSQNMPSSKKTDYSSNSLAQNIALMAAKHSSVQSDAFKQKQLDILSLFTEIYATAQEINKFVTSTKFTAANAVKSTFGGMYAQQLKVQEYIASISGKTRTKMAIAPGFITILSKGEKDQIKNQSPLDPYLLELSDYDYLRKISGNPFAYEQAMFDMNRRAIKLLASKFFPYETPLYSGARSYMNDAAAFTLDEKTINSIHKDLLVYILSYLRGSRFNEMTPLRKASKYGEISASTISSKAYYRDGIFVKKLYDYLVQYPNLQKNPLFKDANFALDKKKNSMDLEEAMSLIIKSVGLQSTQQDELKEAWEEMFLSKDPVLSEIAEDLFYYNFFKNGFDFGPTSFGHLVPSIMKANLSVGIDVDGRSVRYRDLLYAIQEGKIFTGNEHNILNDFVVQYVQNHHSNPRFVTSLGPERAGWDYIVTNILAGNPKYRPSQFTTKVEKGNPLVVSSNEDSVTFKPFVKINGNLYMALSNSNVTGTYSNNIVIGESNITYRKITTVGNNEEYTSYNSKVKDANTIQDLMLSDLGVKFEDVTSLADEYNERSIIQPSMLTTEQRIIASMSPEMRDYYEDSSASRKREILEILKEDPDACIDAETGERIC